MKFKHTISFIPLLLSTATLSAQEAEQTEVIKALAMEINAQCPILSQPVIPDGSTASREDMIAGQGTLKSYIDEGNEYLGCLEAVEKAWGKEITDDQTAVINTLYNNMISNLESSAEAFNRQLKIYQENSAG